MDLDAYDVLAYDLKKNFDIAVAKTHKIDVNNKSVYLTILVGGLNENNPQEYMDFVVSKFVTGRMYNEYVDANLDNPWLRIIIEDVNDLLD